MRLVLQLAGLLPKLILTLGQLVGSRFRRLGHFIDGFLLHSLLPGNDLIELLPDLLQGFKVFPGLFQFRNLLLQLVLRLLQRIESGLLGQGIVLPLRQGLL